MSATFPRQAIRYDALTVVCGTHYIVDRGTLCQALVREGAPDDVLALLRPDLSLDQSIASIHQAARAAAVRAAQHPHETPASGAGPPAAPD